MIDSACPLFHSLLHGHLNKNEMMMNLSADATQFVLKAKEKSQNMQGGPQSSH